MGSAASAELERSGLLLDDLDRLAHKQQHLLRVALSQSRKAATAIRERGGPTRGEAAVGSRVCMWKQDASPSRLRMCKVCLPRVVQPGPKDEDFEVILQIHGSEEDRDFKAINLVQPNSEGDFFVDVQNDTFAFDLVHTYTVARMTLDMYIRDLKFDWRWHWDRDCGAGVPKTPLRIIAHAGEKPNSVYHRGKRVMKFFYYTPLHGKTCYLCRSFDVVAHETGHAILDSLKPKMYLIHEGQARALHEAFADLTAIFCILDQLDCCEEVVAESKSDLRSAPFLTTTGEALATPPSDEAAAHDSKDQEGDDFFGVRNANNNAVGSTCGNSVYGISAVFTGYVYDVLVDAFMQERDPTYDRSDALTLHMVARNVRWLLLLALLSSADVPTFVDLSHGMEKAAEVVLETPLSAERYKRIIAQRRESRELEDAGVKRAVELGGY